LHVIKEETESVYYNICVFHFFLTHIS